MTTILLFQVTFMMACLFLAITLASEAGTAFNDVTFWRQCAIRQGASRDAYSQAGMFRAYGHMTDAYDRACASVAMILLTGVAGLVAAFIG